MTIQAETCSFVLFLCFSYFGILCSSGFPGTVSWWSRQVSQDGTDRLKVLTKQMPPAKVFSNHKLLFSTDSHKGDAEEQGLSLKELRGRLELGVGRSGPVISGFRKLRPTKKFL